jgi:hypothetical protein
MDISDDSCKLLELIRVATGTNGKVVESQIQGVYRVFGKPNLNPPK